VSSRATFRAFQASDQMACLALFDANCPAFFDAGERPGYVQFLAARPEGYEVCLDECGIIGACGLQFHAPEEVIIRWILLEPEVQGRGIGSAMMARALARGRAAGARRLLMAASHKSAPFFARFGARATATTPHGWGPDLHRVDMVLVL